MGIAAVGQGEQRVRVNYDHEPRTLPAEPLRQQFIHALGYVRATAVPDPDELRQSRCKFVLWQFLPERLQQPKRTSGLLLAQMSDELLELLLRGHASSGDSEQPTQGGSAGSDCATPVGAIANRGLRALRAAVPLGPPQSHRG
jgi:hypothetical protein